MNIEYRKYLVRAILLLSLTLAVWIPNLHAQDTVPAITIPEFEIIEKLDDMFSKINTQQIDSVVLDYNSTNNLSDLLLKNSAVSIRSYGASGLSSISMRGGNSNHTAMIWNGFNLQDALNGGYNLATSNLNFIDNIQIQYGGGSSAFGSGAIGGAIHMKNTPIFNKQYFGSALFKLGSFGLNFTNIQFGSSSDKLSSSIRIFKKNITNDFEFVNNVKIDDPIEIYHNASMEQQGLLHELYYKIKSNQMLSSQFWYQDNFREIPTSTASTFDENEEEYQKDSWYRWALNWNKSGEKINYNVRTGLFYTKSNYVNSGIDINSNHNSLRNISEISATRFFSNNYRVTIGLNNNYTVGISNNFNDNPSLNIAAIYLSNHYTILKRIKLNLTLRGENNDSENKPLTYSINSKYNFYKNLYFTTSFSKNYRSPTFNDLFWVGGSASGNINLEDEYGYSKDFGLEFKKINSKSHIKSSISFFHNEINNQIQWIPEGQTWTPKNVKLVETLGIEFALSSDFKISKYWRCFFNSSYAYTDAQVKEKAINESDDILGKQLIYIPFYKANGTIGISFKNISLNATNQYMGAQYTRADNLDLIDSYVLTDLGLQYQINCKKIGFVLSTQVNNIFDITYEARQWYPMPGTNFEIGIKAILK